MRWPPGTDHRGPAALPSRRAGSAVGGRPGVIPPGSSACSNCSVDYSCCLLRAAGIIYGTTGLILSSTGGARHGRLVRREGLPLWLRTGRVALSEQRDTASRYSSSFRDRLADCESKIWWKKGTPGTGFRKGDVIGVLPLVVRCIEDLAAFPAQKNIMMK